MKKIQTPAPGRRLKSVRAAYLFILPYALLFSLFIVIPVAIAIGLSFTNFNTIQAPSFVGFMNYVNLLTRDAIFMQYVLPNTILFAIIVGPGGYVLSFFLAWCLSQISKGPRTVLALLLYSPSMTSGVAMTVVWRILFSGDERGYLNALLLNLGWISEPVAFLQSSEYLMPVMIVVALWSSMGVGFLAMLAGMMNIDETMYEAGSIDGIRNRLQEVFYITIPLMKPQMLFGMVMAVVNTFQVGYIGVSLSGANPTPQYAGQLIVNLIEDYGFIRYEMGYASAASVVLLILIYVITKQSGKLFRED
ncbi:MAG: sugar ABC transporter permease [Clostridia bacterium]|nr:sugar ABC transporter permease [Clostridia bacterium]MBR4537515.1 sugar ABC transporter permease [Clostridia bacterium]